MNKGVWLAAVVLPLFAALGIWLGMPKPVSKAQTRLAAPPCDPVHGPCKAGQGKHSLELYFPQPVVCLKPFQIELALHGWQRDLIEKVTLSFTMVKMNMGQNRFILRPTKVMPDEVQYRGSAMLPVCVSGRVDWLANVEIETASKIYKSVFTIEVQNQSKHSGGAAR